MRDANRQKNRSSLRESLRLLLQLGPIAVLVLPSFVWPCGAPEVAFEEAVRRNLVQAGLIRSYDIITPAELQIGPRQCEGISQNQSSHVCSCAGQRDGVYYLARAGI
jgi:hypothetical protein